MQRLLGKASLGAQILCRFALVEVALRCWDLERTSARLGVVLGAEMDVRVSTSPVLDREQLRRLSRATAKVSARWPWGDTCLRRALVLGSLLEGVTPHLVVGVRAGARDSGGDGPTSYDVHAWLELAGVPLDPTAASFVPLPTVAPAR